MAKCKPKCKSERPVPDISPADVIEMIVDETVKKVQDFKTASEEFVASNEEAHAERWNQKLDPYRWDDLKKEWVKRR